MNMLNKLSDFWNAIQQNLFPFLEEQLPLLDNHKKLITTLELIKIENFVLSQQGWRGRPPLSRKAIARAFVAKAVFNLPTNIQLIDRLIIDKTLRNICGWESITQIPSESTFSRAFDEFSQLKLPEIVQVFTIKQAYGDEIVGHLSRDATDIPMREKSKKKLNDNHLEPKRGGPRHKGPGKCQKQLSQSYHEMLNDISLDCDFGSKVSSKGHRHNWIGYKLHVDVADGSIPISCMLTSASVSDAIMAIPLSISSSQKVASFYEIMDKGYYVDAVSKFINGQGRKALIHKCPKSTKAKEEQEQEKKAQTFLNWMPAENKRQKYRTEVERFFSNLKDNFGGRSIRVKGNLKVFCHLMFGVLALTASQLIRLIC
jgi:Transposase DDE domain/Transposase domain (DUF772)